MEQTPTRRGLGAQRTPHSTGSASEDLNGLDPEYYEADSSLGSDTDPFAGVVAPVGGVLGTATGTN